MYLLLLLVGALGFVAMSLLGLSHGVGGGHHGGGGGHSLGQGHATLGHHAGGLAKVGHGGGHATARGGGRHMSLPHADPLRLIMAITPLDFFTLCMGAGATGEILKSVLHGWQQVAAAAVGAIVLNYVMLKPAMSWAIEAFSKPAEGLEGQVSALGEAITRFDADGKGLVRLSVDGQVVQLLASLDSSEFRGGTTVAKGDKVLVIEIDPARNTCRVSRELAPSVASDAATSSSQVNINS